MFCFLDLCNLCSKITNKAPYNTSYKTKFSALHDKTILSYEILIHKKVLKIT